MSSDFPVPSWEKLRPTWSNWMSSDCLISSFWESIVWKIHTQYFWNWSNCIIYIKNKFSLYVLLIYIPFSYIHLNFWNTNCTLKIKEIKYFIIYIFQHCWFLIFMWQNYEWFFSLELLLFVDTTWTHAQRHSC